MTALISTDLIRNLLRLIGVWRYYVYAAAEKES